MLGGICLSEKHEVKDGVVEIYNQLIDIVGLEHTRKIYEYFKGQQITFPMRFYKSEYIGQEVKQQYDGTNLKELARKYGYTERHIRELLRRAK